MSEHNGATPVLAVQGLVARYGPITALKGVSFEVEPGEIVALIGANGAGKSTTLRAISGVVRPAAGQVLFEGQPIQRLRPYEIVERGVIHCPEGRRIFTRMTVRENLFLGHYTRRRAGDLEQALERVFAMFPILRERQNQLGGTLSGGEQQQLAIARALMVTPKLIMLDEPSLGLAPMLVRQIFDTIVRINQAGITILLVEQNANLALRIASRAYVLEAGALVLHGSGADLLQNDEVRKAYLGEV